MVRSARVLTRKSMALLTSLLLVLFWVPGLIGATSAYAADPGFEIDGNVVNNGGLDWNDVTTSANYHVVHDNVPTDTTSFGSSNKESADPSTWTNSGAGAQHSDVVDVFTYTHNSTVSGTSHAFLDFAFTRNSPNGTDGYFIELDKNGNITHTLNGVSISYPDRSGGAVRFQMKEQGNATMALLDVSTWNTTTKAWESQTINNAGFDSAVSTTDVTPPDSGTFPADSFIEVSLDLTILVNVSPGCPPGFGWVNFRSYTGNSDENLQDYVNGFKAPAASTCSSLKIVKTTADSSHTPLGGATFRITPNPIPGSDQSAGSHLDITDNTSASDVDPNDADATVGTILIDPALPNATGYTITETGAPTGYLTGTATTPGPYVAPDSAAGPTVTFRDPLGDASFTKTDGTNPLGGATFHIAPYSGAALTKYTAIDVTDNTTANDNADANDTNGAVGTVGLGGLYTGVYHITEKTPPTGYTASNATLELTINDANPHGSWTGGVSNFVDTKTTTSLTVHKFHTESNLTETDIQGAVFNLYQTDSGTAPASFSPSMLVGSCTTDVNGLCSVGDATHVVTWDHYFYWVEQSVPWPYSVPDANVFGPVHVTAVNVTQTQPVTQADDPRAGISTTATAAVRLPLAAGTGISDVAHVDGINSSTGGAVRFQAYGPDPTSCTSSPAFTSDFITSYVTVSGHRDYTSNVFTPTTAGTYKWVATYYPDFVDAAHLGTNSISGSCTDTGEQSLVNPALPTMTTSATDTTAVLGTFHDTAQLAGFAAPVTGMSITFSLYSSNTCSGTALFTSTKSFNASGFAQSDDYTATNATGTYYWKVAVTGNTNNDVSNITDLCGSTAGGNHEVSTAPVIPNPTKSPATGTVRVYAPDNTITYTVTVLNTGGHTAVGASVTDPVPAGTTFDTSLSCTGSVSGCNFSRPLPDQIPTWTFDIAAGGTVTIQFRVIANAADTDGQHIFNTATVHSGTYSHDTNTTDHTVIRPLLALGKNANPLPVEDAPSAGTVAPGQTITYTLPLSNTGSDAANGVVVTDQVPQHTTYSPLSAHCENHTTHVTIACTAGHSGASPDVVTWTVDVPAHTTVDVVFSAIVDPKASLTNGDTIPNQGHFTWTYSQQSGGPNLTGDSRTIHHVVTFPIISATKAATPDWIENGASGVVVPGGPIHYVVTVHNGGQADATGVTVTDQVPPGTTYSPNSAVPSASLSGGVLSWTVDVLAGHDTQVAFDVTVNANDSDGQLLHNTAVVNGVDTNTTSHIVEIPIMSVAKTSDPASGTQASPKLVGPNTVITYTLTVTNAGRYVASGFVVTDSVPSGTTYNNDASCNGAATCTVQVNAGVITWTLDVPGGSVSNNVVTPTTRTLTFSVTTPTVQSFLIDNTASFPNTNTPGCTTQSCDTTTTHHEVVFPVINAAKTSSPASGTQANPATVTPGQVITYTIAVTNSGQADATGVVVHDSVPANTTYVAGSADATGGTNNAGVITWTVNVAKGATVNLTFQAQVPSGAGNGTLIDNTATFTNVHTPGCTGETCSTETTHHEVRFPILTLAKSSNPVSGSIVQRGDRIDYTITLANTGLDASAPTTITDTMSTNVTIVSGSASPAFTTVNGNVVTWTVTVPAGQTKTLTYSVTVNSDAPEGATLTNVALINGQCVGNTDESACTTDHHVPTGALTLVKHVDKTTASYGDTLTYTFDAATTGALDQTGVVVTDVLPKGTAYVNGSAACTDGGTCTASFNATSKTVTWQLGDMAAGTTRHLVFKVTIVKPSFNSTTGLPATTIVNSGAIQSNETPNTPSNQVVTKVVEVLGVKVVRPPVLAFTGLPAQVLLTMGLLMLGAGIILTSVRRKEQ